MLLKFAIFGVVFGGVFYLSRLFYPLFEDRVEVWHNKRMDTITPKLDRMFLDIPLRKIILLDILSPVICGIVGFMATRNLWIGVGAGAAGLIIPLLVLKRLEVIRRKKFASQIVDGLMILSSSLKAGLSLLQALEELVGEMPAPISQEFNLVTRQMQMGVSLEDSLISLKRRMRVEELDMVVSSVLIARETGGDLTATFSRVVYTIQERNKLIGRVNSLCVQAKLQGAIMFLLPVVFGIFVYRINPNFFDVFFQDNFGKGLMAYAVISEALGVFFIIKLSKVDI